MHPAKHRFQNDVERYALAARMVTHGVRLKTICWWTGITRWRVKELYRAHAEQTDEKTCVRHRGPTPARAAIFLRNSVIRDESGALAALCMALGGIPTRPVGNAFREVPTPGRGEILCRAYEMYRGVVGSTSLTLENTLLLAVMIADGKELSLGRCASCRASIVHKPYASGGVYLCTECESRRGRARGIKDLFINSAPP